MASGTVRTWAKRIGLGGGLTLAVGVGVVAFNWSAVNARYTAYRLRSAATDEARAELATALVTLGDPAGEYLAEPFHTNDAPTCAAIVAAMQDRLAALPPGDPRLSGLCRALLDAQPGFSAVGNEAAVTLVPMFLKTPDAAARCRELVRAALKSPSSAGRVRAVSMALRPDVRLKADAVPLLDDPEPEVRRAALLAVGPHSDDGIPAIEDEALFKWLHDPDPEVRDLCASALKMRGLDDDQVSLARKLTSPNPADRLTLLLDLRRASESVRDPGPWLERLSRDSDPAVRAGTTRVAYECRLMHVGWADRLADADPDATVRRLAGYYRNLATTLKQTGFVDGDR